MSFAEKLQTIAENEQKVYDAGLRYGVLSDRIRRWNSITDNGVRTNYENAFYGHSWNDDTFDPTCHIAPAVATRMFSYSKITDLQALLSRCGVTLDFSYTTNAEYAFHNSAITRVGVIDTANFLSVDNIFNGAKNLTTIDKLMLPYRSRSFTAGTFAGCGKLTNVVFEKQAPVYENEITDYYGNAYLNVTNLSPESMVSFISCLYDAIGNGKSGYAYTIKFSDACWAALNAAIAAPDGCDTWQDYVYGLGYNV